MNTEIFKNPKPKMFDLDSITLGLSRIPRFTGQTKGVITVLQHSVLVYELVRDSGGSAEEKCAALLHDASEAYTGDLPAPIKAIVPEFKERVETPIMKAIYTRFGLTLELLNNALVKDCDGIAYKRESQYTDNPELDPPPYEVPWMRPWVYKELFFNARRAI